MAGIPTVPDTTGRQVVDSLGLGRSTGTTAQSWAGPVMDADSSSLANSSSVVAPGTANPADTRPGYLAAGQPGGNPAVLVPGGQYDTDNQVQLIGSPAGTAGGGAPYPNITGADAVPDPMLSPGWTVQTNAADEIEQMVITTASPLPAATHNDAYSQTLTVTGGVGAKTWTLESGALPSPCTLSSSGVISGTPTAEGAASFEAKVTDANGNEAQKIFSITVN